MFGVSLSLSGSVCVRVCVCVRHVCVRVSSMCGDTRVKEIKGAYSGFPLPGCVWERVEEKGSQSERKG